MHEGVISGKTLARLAAVQFVFQQKFRGCAKSVSDLVTDVEHYYATEAARDFAGYKAKLHKAHFSLLVSLVTRHSKERVEDMVQEALQGWDAKDYLTLAVLEVGLCELHWGPALSPAVVVSEFTNIASSFGLNTDKVNAILDQSSKKAQGTAQPSVGAS